ncbi:Gfo/Idh/MocA family protein [Alicyclobacillus fastidiosus]|uniref:Gfo/Idh/MocA family oxidoreductase n=1 Tax=Alicyclobacillus fastidiosus TaxID=392011 RepID=A0ABV5AJE7_9BACL|nr:Gfo/Idh/MocA family oxidoreductase [Alicyclobacillus fastidiosus]WEH08354.1 Gfo/Idh/MocA family oxidoreductase [Alicyclobacillus fastidiosus]
MVRIGFVGVGGIAQEHLEAIRKSGLGIIVAVCDIVHETVKCVAEKYQATPYTDYIEMLEKEVLDALYVCVPPFAHNDIEELAAGKGIHLFVEKPLGLDMPIVERKEEAIKQSGIIHASGYCLRYLDIVQEAKEYLYDKKIAMIDGYYFTSFVQTPWYRQMNRSGGQLVEQSTHIVDLVRYLAGEDVSSVYASMALNVSYDIEGIDIYDVGSVNLNFLSGTIGHVSTTFTQPDHRTSVEVQGKDFRIQIIDFKTLCIVEKDNVIERKTNMNFYFEQDVTFLTAVREKNQRLIRSSYSDGLQTLKITLAANESSKSNEVIKLY